MTIFELPDGRWRAKEGTLQREGKTKKIAEKRLLAAIATRNRLTPGPDMTVAALLDAYLLRCEGKNRAAKTIRDYTYHSEALKESIGHYQVGSLTGEMIENEALAGLPPKTQINRKAVLRAAIEKIIRKRYPKFPNAAKTAETASYKSEGARTLMESEVSKLLGAEKSERCLAMWLLLLDTGLRPDEAYGLMWSEIRREEDGWWLQLQESKTEEGKKPIPLVDATMEALRKVASDIKWVFPSPVKKDQPLGQTFWCDKFKALVKASGINPERVTPYSFRHTCANILVRKEKAEVVQRLMRHTDFRTTQKYYIEVGAEELRKAKR